MQAAKLQTMGSTNYGMRSEIIYAYVERDFGENPYVVKSYFTSLDNYVDDCIEDYLYRNPDSYLHYVENFVDKHHKTLNKLFFL